MRSSMLLCRCMAEDVTNRYHNSLEPPCDLCRLRFIICNFKQERLVPAWVRMRRDEGEVHSRHCMQPHRGGRDHL